jgi:hypothetical protein
MTRKLGQSLVTRRPETETVLKGLTMFFFLTVVNRSWSTKPTRKATNQKSDMKVALMELEPADTLQEELAVLEDIHRVDQVVLEDIHRVEQVVLEDTHQGEQVVPEDIHRGEQVVLEDILQDDQVVPEEAILQEELEELAVAIPQEALVESEVGMLQEDLVVPEVGSPPEGKAEQVADIPVVEADQVTRDIKTFV